MDTLRKETPVAECSYGWGQVFRLYHDRLEVNGVSYPLNKLAHVRPVYQRVMGIDSVRLELRFGGKRLILRGIAAIEDARRAITYLNSVYLGLGSDLSDEDSQTRWNRTGEESTPLEADEACGGGIHDASRGNPAWEAGNPAWEAGNDLSLPATLAQSIAPPHRSSTFDMTPLPSTASYRSPQRIITAKVAAASWERFRRDQRERRERRIHIERMLREFGFDVEQLEQRLKEEALPEIAVPLRLLPGERAHYSADAALCDEPVSGPACSTYPARDHGLLILTNKRLLFLGRKSQVVLDYARLTDVVRLRSAVALEAKHWYKREIFEVQRPLECVMYLERLHERWQQSAALRPQFRTISSDFFDNQAHSEHLPVINIDTLPLAQQSWETSETSHQEYEPM